VVLDFAQRGVVWKLDCVHEAREFTAPRASKLYGGLTVAWSAAKVKNAYSETVELFGLIALG